MYQCPTCGGRLSFDIPSQKLLCNHCGGQLSPYHFDNLNNATKSECYEATVYTCACCGAELICDDTTVSTFCSYCGSSELISHRLRNEARPKYIIPFSVTKEECKKFYQDFIRQAVFAPSALQNPDYIEHFRAIYMPYWLYTFRKKGTVEFPASQVYYEGDKKIVSRYSLSSEIDAKYNDIAFDASSAFSDRLSKAIAPFEVRHKCVPFSPAFLEGFYADGNDLKSTSSETEAAKIAAADIGSSLKFSDRFKQYTISDREINSHLIPDTEETNLAFLPVWFLAYRNKNRVAYAVVNGQTGRIAADLPIDITKLLCAVTVLSIVFFCLLNSLFILPPATLLWLSILLTILCGLFNNLQISQLLYRDNENFRKRIDEYEAQKTNKKEKSIKPIDHSLLTTIVVLIIVSLGIIVLLDGSPAVFAEMVIWILIFATAIIVIRTLLHYLSYKIPEMLDLIPCVYCRNWKWKIPHLILPLSGFFIALAILIWNPVDDFYYYIGSIACIVTLLLNFIGIIRHHNQLATIALPQFNKKRGGE